VSSASVTLIVLAAGTYVLKAAGPLLLSGRRTLPAWAVRATALTPAALLAAMVATGTVSTDGELLLDARLPGVLAAGVALKLRAPFVVVVLIAAATTSACRALAAALT
jgi:branched-subunit amino acid transport protein